ncbi:MAG: hypothetical protein SGJ17_12265 [Hyphomicrobiales bacterium]|nr:hypothetical protein [Hyphomicrobiales bacterium]
MALSILSDNIGQAGIGMRLFFSSAGFIFTVAVGVAAFVLSAIHAPTELKQMIDAANVFISQVLSAYVEDRYSVLIGFVFDGKNLVLMGFIIATRLVFSILMSVLFPAQALPGRDVSQSQSQSQSQGQSPFKLWGRRGS